MARLRRLAGQMGLSPVNCREVMTAHILASVAMFGAELWLTGDHVRGTIGQANELQLLVNQEARATTSDRLLPDDQSWPCRWRRDSGRQLCSWRTGRGGGYLACRRETGPGRSWVPQQRLGGGSRMPSPTPEGRRVQFC